MTKILDGQTSNTTGTTPRQLFEVAGDRSSFNGITVSNVFAGGTWNGATVTLEYSPDKAGPWVTTSDLTFTDDGAAVIELNRRFWIRATLSSAGASTDVSLWVI